MKKKKCLMFSIRIQTQRIIIQKPLEIAIIMFLGTK